jgi:hypothetical protein
VPKYLIKANDEVLSFCKCHQPLAALPGQLDCPWCGCGWLVSCIDCRKAFAFAKVVEVDLTYESIVRRDSENCGVALTDDEVSERAGMVAWMMEPLALGEMVAYLDGCFIALDDPDLHFAGIFARHDLDTLPQVAARTDIGRLDTLKDSEYWLQRERPDRDR